MRRRTLVALLLCLVFAMPDTAAAAGPIAGNDQAVTPEDMPVQIDVLANDTDPEGDPVGIRSVGQPANGTAALSPFVQTVTYTPNRNFNGTDRFTYTAADTNGETATADVVVFVSPVEDQPVAVPNSVDTAFDTPVTISLVGMDPESCELSFAIVTWPAAGFLDGAVEPACQPGGGDMSNIDTATLTYTPHHFSGIDSFSYVVRDSAFVVSDTAVVEIHVAPATPMHVADIDASVAKRSGSWHATSTVVVADTSGQRIAGAVVVGSWTSGSSTTCTTDGSGRCAIASPSYARKLRSATFTVAGVVLRSFEYDDTANADPDGDSTGTSIMVTRP